MLVNLAYLLRKPTGTTTYALNLIPALTPLNPVFLATPASGLQQYYPVPNNLTAEYGLKGHLRRLLWTQFQLPRICRSQIQQHTAQNLLFSPITEAPLFSRCRSVVMVHDLIPLRFPGLSPALTQLYRHYVPRVLTAADHKVCNSQATAADIVRFYGISAQKITPILLAYDAEHFQPLPLEQQPYFLVLGRQAPYKNVGIALQAFAQIPHSEDFTLRIAGPPDRRYTPTLVQQAQALGVSDRVEFLDYVPYEQLPRLLNQATALVFPSLWEGFGLPVLEAMACGTPVIASDRSSLPEVTGEAALLVNPTQASELTQAMQAVIQDGALRSQLRQAGLQQAAKFSWQRTGEETVNLLKAYL